MAWPRQFDPYIYIGHWSCKLGSSGKLIFAKQLTPVCIIEDIVSRNVYIYFGIKC